VTETAYDQKRETSLRARSVALRVRERVFRRAPSPRPRTRAVPFKLAQASRARFGKKRWYVRHRRPSPRRVRRRRRCLSPVSRRRRCLATPFRVWLGIARCAKRAPRRISGVGTASRPASGGKRAGTPRARSRASARRSRASSPALAAPRRASRARLPTLFSRSFLVIASAFLIRTSAPRRLRRALAALFVPTRQFLTHPRVSLSSVHLTTA
jgi:hypothetical protein